MSHRRSRFRRSWQSVTSRLPASPRIRHQSRHRIGQEATTTPECAHRHVAAWLVQIDAGEPPLHHSRGGLLRMAGRSGTEAALLLRAKDGKPLMFAGIWDYSDVKGETWCRL